MAHIKYIITVLLLFTLLSFAIKISIIGKDAGHRLQYYKAELKFFLNIKMGIAHTSQRKNADWDIALSKNQQLKEAGFSVTAIFEKWPAIS